MLKRLELVGFKSFADRTAFDFADGLTGIIGPNGSGKSNVVDAVRWVLGEQSAKSLRGGEMTDVIFNGSASRRTLGMAEVCMVFDNSKRQLASQADEVRLARRVYRSGESEYLLNGEACRLKEIKDVLLGSGAGTDAYCIIEQGRVELLLQAAPKERRTIFEEAAGISRFKARKTDALRRLDRTASNLERLKDILDEVEKKLRSVDAQAAKANSYLEYSARLRTVRECLSLREYHGLAARLGTETTELESLRVGLEEQKGHADNGGRDLEVLNGRLEELDAGLKSIQSSLATAQQAIAEEKGRRDGEEKALVQAEEELARLRERLAGLSLAVRRLEEACRLATQERLHAMEDQAQYSLASQAFADEQATTESLLKSLSAQAAAQKDEHFDRMEEAGKLSNAVVGYKSKLEHLTLQHGKLQEKSDQAAESLATIDGEMEGLTGAEASLQVEMTRLREAQRTVREKLTAIEQAQAEATNSMNDLREQRSGLTSRIEVLEGLERSNEGLSSGAREVLAHLQVPDPGPWRTVVGLVAEAFTVRREYAPLIDLALGERSQRFLVEDEEALARALRERGSPLPGRASFYWLGALHSRDAGDRAAVAGHPGLVILAVEAVRCEDERFTDLPRRLLGGTLIVRDLEAARALSSLAPGCRCVTLQGELLEPDGTLTVGTHHAEGGILSRRSELRELRKERDDLDVRAVALERELAGLREQRSKNDHRAGHLNSESEVLTLQIDDMQSRISEKERQRENLSADVSLNRSDLVMIGQDLDQTQAQWEDALRRLAEAQASVADVKDRLETSEREMRRLEAGRGEQQRQATEAIRRLAQAEERLRAVLDRADKAEVDREAKQAEAVKVAEHVAQKSARIAQIEASLLRSASVLAEEYQRKERAERDVMEGQALQAQMRQRRKSLTEQVQASRTTWEQQQKQAHEREITVTKLTQARDAICQRLRDDYGVDLSELYAERVKEGSEFDIPPTAEGEARSPEEEIADLRRKITKLGNVNLEAIAELAELQERHGGLKEQYDDLMEARLSLEGTIGRINTDCRRLFTETFDAIRGQFQELFRKLFGGGRADVVLEEGVDVLDAGIEVIAQPPGKELRGITLMSGGEKTMTAVALLLAIFRSKPSPFCILDEVDAALDEANVGRFTGVLRDFAGTSQFILITHRHRTIQAVDVLYGVTMAEPGVSSRFSARYEDYVEGEAKAAA